MQQMLLLWQKHSVTEVLLCGSYLRTAAAEESIRIMTTEYPDMVVGAGTVLTTDQVDRAIAAGAKFIVSLVLIRKIVTYCIEKIYRSPGVVTPSEIAKAIELGLDVVKFFLC